MMRAYTQLLVDTCKRRGAQAIGGMAAFVPNSQDPDATQVAMAHLRADKAREAEDGFDGAWVAHPAMVQPCLDAFTGPSHDPLKPPASITARDLMAVGTNRSPVTIAGVRTNVRVALLYLTAWVGGRGAVAIDNVMEDAATVEISRAQIWQWLRHRTKTAEGLVVTRPLVREIVEDVIEELHANADGDRAHRHVEEAREVFTEVALGETLPDFFTPYAYVRYVIERPLQPRGPITEADLQRSMRGPFADDPTTHAGKTLTLVGTTD
jgi:malate synthase